MNLDIDERPGDSKMTPQGNHQPINNSETVNTTPSTLEDKPKDGNDKSQRWGNDQDKHVFQILNEYLSQKGSSLSQFVKESGVTESNQDIITSIASQTGWKRRIKFLYKRIQKLAKDCDNFSIRDLKLFKRVLRNQLRNRSKNYHEILSHFPGKTFEVVQKLADELEKTY